MKKVLVVGAALAASIAGLVWAPKVAVVEVDMFGAGLDKRLVIPESRSNEDGKAGEKPREFVRPSQTIIHPGKAEVVIAHLGRVHPETGTDVRISGETRKITVRVDWTRVFAEWALIFGCAAFALGVMNYRNELSVEMAPLPSSSPNMPLQRTADAETGSASSGGQGGRGS